MRLSAEACLIKSALLAPTDILMASSRARPDARTSIRPAMLEQAIKRTNATAPSKISIGVSTLPLVSSVKGSMPMLHSERRPKLPV